MNIAGDNVLEKSDLQPVLKALKDRLMTKNMTEDIAEKLCESVAGNLEGKKLHLSQEYRLLFRKAMEEALLHILTPRRSIDILRDVHAANERGRPYVTIFGGVNVVAYWLLQHNLSVTLAACDTFRSGAVEQLRTHAHRLLVVNISSIPPPPGPMTRARARQINYEGYEKDPAVLAKEAIEEASRNKSAVFLVETAGRMQDNQSLMRALSKLINLNSPDLVLFVGEALVGNVAVDQITNFNKQTCLLFLLARLIDGILLTKFDTIDDKLEQHHPRSTYQDAPVMFVGCDQSYTDLKKLNVKSIVKTLLK
ncbi:hypothetical protein ACP70R_013190 [Stipagrostis hirtigluma subsp. patula]